MIIIETCPECGHDLIDYVIDTYPPIETKQCLNCGRTFYGEREEIVRVPYRGNSRSLNQTPSACQHCPNHPDNGGNGICNCTLGLPNITC